MLPTKTNNDPNQSLITQTAEYPIFDLKNTVDDGNSKLGDFEESIIQTIFAIFIVLGIFGNLLVIWTVLFNKNMRTTNNLFILNLAISDLTLCFFSIPFNVYKTLRHTWSFGEFLCRLAPFFQASNVYVSSMSITAIALDRYVRIVCAMKIRQSNSFLQSWGATIMLLFIWLFAFILSSPLFIYNNIHTLVLDIHNLAGMVNINMDENEAEITTEIPNNMNLPSLNTTVPDYSYFEVNMPQTYKIFHCVENWPRQDPSYRLIYSYTSMLIQYILPILIVGIAYGSIWCKLNKQRKRLKSHHNKSMMRQSEELDSSVLCGITHSDVKRDSDTGNQNKFIKRKSLLQINQQKKQSLNPNAKYEVNRRRKMNILLACIAFIFAASWLPLNLFNILSDYELIKANHLYYVLNAVCILFGMSSAVSNPILYGLLNENFKREYTKVFSKFLKRLLVCCGSKSERILPKVTITEIKLTNIGNNNRNKSQQSPQEDQQDNLI